MDEDCLALTHGDTATTPVEVVAVTKLGMHLGVPRSAGHPEVLEEFGIADALGHFGKRLPRHGISL